MPPLTFKCIHCHNSIGVAPEFAGLPVACPHCQQVVTAPPKPVPAMDSNIHTGWAAVEVSTANLRASQKQAKEREDSIFSESEADDDDEALFGLGSGMKNAGVEMPETLPAVSVRNTPHDLTQPTQRVPGLAASPPKGTAVLHPVRKIPVATSDSKAFAGTMKLYPTPTNGTVDSVNPFVMEAAIPSEFAEPSLVTSESTVTRRPKAPAADSAPNWKLWIIIGLAAYSFLLTVVAIWGWMRSPQTAAPVKHDAPVTVKAKR